LKPYGESLEIEKFGLKKTLEVFKDIALTIHFTDHHGIYHRDLKPANIVIHNGRGILIDWGISTTGGK